MQIAVIADSGEVIDSVDMTREDLAAALEGRGPERSFIRSALFNAFDTVPIRRFVGLPVPGGQ